MRRLPMLALISVIMIPMVVLNAQKARFQEVEKWNIPNGGSGRVIVIKANPTRDDIQQIVHSITTAFASDRNSFVQGFDNASAASNRRRAISNRLGDAEMKSYDRHTILSCNRNPNTGDNVCAVTLKGLDGPQYELPYR